MQVLNERGESLDAVTYQVCEERKRPFVAPHPSYVKIVRQGLDDWGKRNGFGEFDPIEMLSESLTTTRYLAFFFCFPGHP